MEQRASYLDVLRIVAIFSVILLHCNTDFFPIADLYPSSTWLLANCINGVSRFGVPVFFMVSGYLLLSDTREESMGQFYSKRLLRVLPPFLVWNIIYYMVLCAEGKAQPYVFDFCLRLIHQSISYHFWFVYMIVWFYLFTPFFKKMVQHCTQKQLWLLLFFILVPTTLFPLLNYIVGYWFFTSSPVIEGYFGYFLLGYLLGHFDIPKKYRHMVYGAAVICIPIVIWETYTGSSGEQIETFFNGGYQCNAYIMGSAVFLFVKYNMLKGIDDKKAKVLTHLGNLSFGLYLCHVLVIEGLHTVLPLVRADVQILSYTLLTFFGGYALLLVLYQVKVLRKILF